MIYSLIQLRELILPIIQSMPRGDAEGATDAIMEILEQDRENTAQIIQKALREDGHDEV